MWSVKARESFESKNMEAVQNEEKQFQESSSEEKKEPSQEYDVHGFLVKEDSEENGIREDHCPGCW